MSIRLFDLLGRWFPLLLWVIAAHLAFGRAYLLALNLTESLPGTLFLVEKDVMPARGELVAFRWEANWPYPRGSLFLKRLIGLPGSSSPRQAEPSLSMASRSVVPRSAPGPASRWLSARSGSFPTGATTLPARIPTASIHAIG
jgi:hypothetical protein